MTMQTINLGTAPGGAGGDTARSAFEKAMANFEELFSQGYRKNNVVGTVEQSGGVPTAAIIEQGSNANGRYTRFADGTQICMKMVTWSQHTGGGAQSATNIQNAASFVGQVYSFLSQNCGWGQNVKHWMEGQSSNGATVYVRNDHVDPLDITVFWLSVGRWY
ncbi:hypothetical protein [Azotobacter beijerinckii]|uniref:Uncharacterized protein n=1 Tax=Azotobacter beijerinckii TaxID=170623 RepID=A0A1I0Z0E3_9GAMM|nr:hypothetical protein [Azotobacter beijerinckii]SFB18892.1 hypothetical protein SAMN04244571_01711 [Azotobacter beijerinckii]